MVAEYPIPNKILNIEAVCPLVDERNGTQSSACTTDHYLPLPGHRLRAVLQSMIGEDVRS